MGGCSTLAATNDMDITVRFALRLAALVCLTSTASTAMAQSAADLVGTTKVTFTPISSAGVVQACSYTFHSIVQDTAYKAGALTAVNGSLTFWADKSSARIGLKVGLGSLDATGKMAYSAPIDAFIKSRNGSTAQSAKLQAPSDTPGFVLYTFSVDKHSTGVVADLMEGTPFQVGFNRKKGGMDVYATVDPEVANSANTPAGLQRTRSKEAPSAFFDCMGELLAKAKQ